ncbi:hypothetical protein Leryth_020254 [Lithospermum erythrorhizon]|nr:hypothetical protein Leryth_020254 [Lithospermum erythrorhizon]
MGGCFSSPATVNQTPSTTANISSAGVSQITNNTTTSNSSNISKDSLFSTTNGTSGEASPNGHTVLESGLRVFSYAELKAATKSFRNDTVLGEGGFGKVYKGWLDEKGTSKSGSGSVIAVKKLNSGSVQGFEEWQSEVNFLGNLSHSNLVKLLGYCYEENELLLVYEFMQKGSLENHLFGRGSTAQPLPWETRLKILIGAARGLGFLHSLARQVIYRDFKASNILLDGSYNAKISDFGLAKLGPTESRSHVTTRVMGTQGYAAPEYVATGHLYSDAYATSIKRNLQIMALDLNRRNDEYNCRRTSLFDSQAKSNNEN